MSKKIKILQLATFHMGETTDFYKSPYDAFREDHLFEIKSLCEKVALFNPTVICVEVPVEEQKKLRADYKNYLTQETYDSNYKNEVSLIAYQIGKQTNVKRIYGIDHKLEYDYPSIEELANKLKTKSYLNFMEKELKAVMKKRTKLLKKASLQEIMKYENSAEALDFLMNVNADILTYVNSKKAFEGADVAADYYKRNLRIYANLNKLKLKKKDRVLILMGSGHIAFLRDFLKRSPIYEVVETNQYLEN